MTQLVAYEAFHVRLGLALPACLVGRAVATVDAAFSLGVAAPAVVVAPCTSETWVPWPGSLVEFAFA